MAAFGREMAHTCSSASREIPVISMDYCFLSKRGLFDHGEWTPLPGEQALKILIVRDSRSKVVFAHAVPTKGVDQHRHVIDCIVDDITWLGHVKVLLKGDNEEALNSVIR